MKGALSKSPILAQDRRELHRSNQDCRARTRRGCGVFASAKSRSNVCVSSEKRPPVSAAMTTSLARPLPFASSGHVLSLRRRVKARQHHPLRDNDGVAPHRHEEVTPTWRQSPGEPRGTQEAPQRSPRSGVGPWHQWAGRGRARTHSLRLWRRPRGNT